MRIGIDGRLLDKRRNTGISRYTEFLLKYYIMKYGAENIYVIVNSVIDDYKSVHYVNTKLKPFNILHFFRYSSFISTLNLDILHIPFYSGTYFRVNQTKVIVTVHDLMYKLVDNFFNTNYFLNYVKKKYFDFIVKETLRNADTVISVSKTTQADVLYSFNVESVHVPELSIVKANPDDSILKKINVSKKGFFFYCGNNRPHKNLQFVIDVFNSVPNLPPLVLAGAGHYNSNNVKAIGIVTDEELKSLYRSCIAFIFPSKYEGFGLPILESLNCKTLVIASKIPAFLEFKSKNISFFEIGNTKSLIEVIKETMEKNYVEEPHFFAGYSIDKIYSLLDLYCIK